MHERPGGTEIHGLDHDTCARVLADVERLPADAFRTLGVAYRRLKATEVADADESLEQELVYAGTVGIVDPPRPEAGVAVHESLRAGVRVIMITGDHPARRGTGEGRPGAEVRRHRDRDGSHRHRGVNARSATSSAFHRLFVNPWLWSAIALSLVLQIAVVHIPFLNAAFGTVPLSLG